MSETVHEVDILGSKHKLSNFYKTEKFVSHEYKIEILARMLAGYDEQTWRKLAEGRKRTYRRAGATLLTCWEDFKERIEEFKCNSDEKH